MTALRWDVVLIIALMVGLPFAVDWIGKLIEGVERRRRLRARK